MRMIPLSIISSIVLAVLAIGCAGSGDAADPPVASGQTAGLAAQEIDCPTVETREANAPDQRPAFPGQTRACAVDSEVAFEVDVLARGLVHPWAVEPLPGGDLLITERPGRLRIVTAAGDIGAPISGLPPVHAEGQGGLLDVALSPTFTSDSTIYWSYAEPRDVGNGTSVARGVLSDDRGSVGQVEVIFRAMPTYTNSMHYGSRLAFGPDGMLYITTGERSDTPMRVHAQRLDNHLGKVLRIRPDGSVPEDNPFTGQGDAQPEVWTLGHRNIQASTFDPEGRLWTVEHGPKGGDEVNLIQAGKNYGWPLVSYGEEYSGEPIPDAVTQREGFEQPVYYWDPVIAPSGAQWYTGEAFPDWRGDLFIGGMVANALVRLEMEDGRVVGEEHLLTDRGQRVRDVRQGPDGALYIVTDEDNGELWRVAPSS
ncbi:MAG TPA: PQQ-dependent sugar dehydrogenase [Longimicrobiaceae bacterium]|nr:PQQ-dependent sugar dehydrogenase [Longimicrobiaceae bacterium]